MQLSVRPEKIVLDATETDGMVRLPGTVAERVYVGTATQVIIELEGGARVVALEQNTAAGARRRPLGAGRPRQRLLASRALLGLALSIARKLKKMLTPE